MVEGHTDNVAYRRCIDRQLGPECEKSNFGVRILQKEYGLDPKKMSAAGRGEYNPVFEKHCRKQSSNRRTRIVILPQLDQFFKLLEPKKDPS
jgi:chemotaxis protein MotB